MKFTSEEDQYLRDNYLHIPAKRMSKNLGRSESGARQRMVILGLKVPGDIIEKFKKDSRIKPGATPPNKGKKQTEYMSAEAIERTKATRFNKGNKPHNCYDEVGKITIRHDHAERGGKPYKYICLAIGSWRPYHQHLWEQQNGKVPKNHCLWFKDGDSLNVDLDNLECITRKENILRNNDPENPTDNKVAMYMALNSRKVNKELQQEILKHPELIETKRNQLKLQRKVKNHGKEQINRS